MLPRQRQVLARFSVSALVASLPLLYVSLLRPPPAALAGDTAFWFLMSNCVIAAIIAADDAGTLFSGYARAGSPCCHDDNLSSYVSGGGQPAVAFDGAMVPFVASEDDVPTAVNARFQEVLPSTAVTSSLSPFLIRREDQGDAGEDPATKSSTDHLKQASILLRGQGDEVAIEKPSTDEKNSNVIWQGQGEAASTSPSIYEPAIVKADDVALAGPEAWATALQSRTPDLHQGKGEGEGKLRRSATEGSKPAAGAEEREYWELSDEELNRRVEEFIAQFNREMRRQIEQEAEA